MAEPTMEAVRSAMTTLLREILDGSSEGAGWVLNPRDPGLLGSLARVSASDASAVPPGGSSSTASHAEHLRYSLSLLNAIEPVFNSLLTLALIIFIFTRLARIRKVFSVFTKRKSCRDFNRWRIYRVIFIQPLALSLGRLSSLCVG